MKKLKSMCMVLLFAVLVAAGVVDAPTVEAGGGSLYVYGLNETDDLTVYYGKETSFSSSDSTVATVSDDGIVTTVSYGEAVITVTWLDDAGQVQKKELTISVVKPKIITAEITMLYQPGYYEHAYQNHKPQNLNEIIIISDRNPKAAYTYSTNSKLIKIESDGTIQEVTGNGVAKIIVTENYNNQEESVGIFKVRVKERKADKCTEDKYEIGDKYWVRTVDSTKIIDDYFYETISEGKKIFVLSDKKIRNQKEFVQNIKPVMPKAGKNQSKNVLKYVYDKKGKWEGTFLANKSGSTYVVEAYYNYITGKYVFAHCEKVTVTDK